MFFREGKRGALQLSLLYFIFGIFISVKKQVKQMRSQYHQ